MERRSPVGGFLEGTGREIEFVRWVGVVVVAGCVGEMESSFGDEILGSLVGRRGRVGLGPLSRVLYRLLEREVDGLDSGMNVMGRVGCQLAVEDIVM